MKEAETNEINLITKKLDDACFIDFGTRVVQKKDGGNIYPVYGGGGATFKMDTYNRENRLVVSRFAMSKQCTRFVEGKFYLNDSGLTVRPKNEKELAQEYLDYLLLTLNDTIYSLSRGTAQRNLNVSKFRNLEIKYPDSVTLQLHIANLLSKAENLIAQRKESIRLLDEFLKSTFLEMFGDPTHNPKKWQASRLDQVSTRITDGKHGDCADEPNSGYYFLSAKDLIDGKLKYTDVREITQSDFIEVHRRTDLKLNDILLGNTGASIGKIGIVTDAEKASRTTFQKSISIITVKTDIIVPLYLKMYLSLNRKIFNRTSTGSAMSNLLLSQIRAFNILIPSLELQTQFSQIVEKTEALKTQYQQSLQELENLYGSLSQKAFRGELTINKAVSV